MGRTYLAELLLEKGHEVHGIVRRVALQDPSHPLQRIYQILDQIALHPASLESFPSLYTAIQRIQLMSVTILPHRALLAIHSATNSQH